MDLDANAARAQVKDLAIERVPRAVPPAAQMLRGSTHPQPDLLAPLVLGRPFADTAETYKCFQFACLAMLDLHRRGEQALVAALSGEHQDLLADLERAIARSIQHAPQFEVSVCGVAVDYLGP